MAKVSFQGKHFELVKMRLKALFLASVRFLTLTKAAVVSPHCLNSTKIRGDISKPGLQVYRSKLSPEAHSLSIKNRAHHKQRPEWIARDVWDAINTMIITSSLLSAENSSASNSSPSSSLLQRRNGTDPAPKYTNPFDDAPYPDFDPFGDLHNEDM